MEKELLSNFSHIIVKYTVSKIQCRLSWFLKSEFSVIFIFMFQYFFNLAYLTWREKH